MTQTGAETVVAGTGHFYVGEVDVPRPTDPADTPDPDWLEMGYTIEDGVTFSLDRTIRQVRAWPAKDPILTILQGIVTGIASSLLQWNRDTLEFALGAVSGSFVETSPGIYELDSPDEVIDHRSILMRWSADTGDRDYQLWYAKGNITGPFSTALALIESPLPFAFTPLRKDQDTPTFKFTTNDPAFTPLTS